MHPPRLLCVAHISAFSIFLLLAEFGLAGTPPAAGPTANDGGKVPEAGIIETVIPTSTWSGAHSTLWSDPLNWDTPPSDGYNIDIPAGSMNTNMTNDTTFT